MDLSSLYNRWGQLKQQLADQEDQRNAQVEASITPEDQSTYANTFRNQAINTLGLPQDWQSTVADEKRLAAQPQPVEARNLIADMAAGPEAETGELAAQGAEKLTPQLKQWAQQIANNPNAPIAVSGNINMGAFQKLRDALGHVGPVVVKGGQ